MLSEIRDRATGWIAYIIVGIIAIPFAFWGVNEYFAGGEEVVVATVGDAEIQQAEYRQALESRRSQMRRVLGESFQPELVNSLEFKRGVVEDLISRTLLEQHAADQGYRVSDEQLARSIRAIPRFRVGDEFSSDAYASAVAQLGFTQAGFESRMRQQLVLEQLRAGIRDTAFVTPDQQGRMIELLLQERRFDYAVLGVDRFLDQVEISDDEIQGEYQSNSDRYRTPERVKVEYVELSVDEIAPAVEISEEDLRQAYQANKERYSTAPVRRASHILIETAADATEEQRQKALDKAERLREELRSGADFAKLAREQSQDPGSASKGGDLGRIEPGSMVEPFQEALFALNKEGAVTGPVRTRFGYHLIKLTEYQPAEVKPFDEVRDELAVEQRRQQAESLFLDRAETFRNVSYEQPQALEPVADQLDLDIQQSGWFTRQKGAGIASNAKVREAAFGEDVYREGLNSEAIELDVNTLVVLRRLDSQPASVKPLAEVRDQIETRLRRTKAQQRVASLGPKLVEQLRSGTDWSTLVQEQGLDARTVSWSRDRVPQADDPRPAVIEAVFELPAPSTGQAVPGGRVLDSGGYALYRLQEVVAGDADKAPEQLQQRVHESLRQRRGQDLLTQYIAALRQATPVSIREQAL